jgi:hypothetical protein
MSWGRFYEFLSSPAPQTVLGLALLASLCIVAGYAIGKIRRGFRESGHDASNMMSNFRDLHSRGELSDEEYRTIKARLADRLQRQLELPERQPELPRREIEVPEQELEGFGQDTEQDG